MSWKRQSMEAIVWAGGKLCRSARTMPQAPGSILVLRNGDIGDLLVITPLFEALRKLFPESRIVAGVGCWNLPTLQLNPYISDSLILNAPWHNKFVQRQGLIESIRYIVSSPEVDKLIAEQFDIGIDILGSTLGSLLMLAGHIPYRLGVKGYAGGHTAVQAYFEYNQYEHVGRSALRFAELLGAGDLPAVRPQIFLSQGELEQGRSRWGQQVSVGGQLAKRVVIAPGGGYPAKCWPVENFVELARGLGQSANVEMIVLGGQQDIAAGEVLQSASCRVCNLAGRTSLRETFSIVASADLVISNTSFVMHVGAAYYKPTLVLLGNSIDSAEQHAAQWGYDGDFYILGKDKQRSIIYSPDEVLDRCMQILGNAPAGVN